MWNYLRELVISCLKEMWNYLSKKKKKEMWNRLRQICALQFQSLEKSPMLYSSTLHAHMIISTIVLGHCLDARI
jgi:hypothetical protein